jgi:nicotinamide-nucleotide amidase
VSALGARKVRLRERDEDGTVPGAAPPVVRLHSALLARGETVAAAESLTAGLFCATLATVPGASATLRGGVVVYATDLKTSLAGVPADVLAGHGPVSPETATALAEGVRVRCTATWGIGLTGVAGPDPVDGHGAGRVYLGISDGRRTEVRRLDLPGDRAAVRAGAVEAAVETLLARLG